MKGNVKTSRTIRKAMAFVMAAALTVSSLVVSPTADAASKKAPKLAKSKKTLYYNKSGKKSFTLKLKKNKAKIKSVTWKTSKKSVAKLSKKKKTSVKVTAKKKGTAKIKAVVKYTLNGKSKKKTLTCTVKSKKYTKSSGNSDTNTENPTQSPDASQAPTEQGTTIALSATSAAISTVAGKNTVTLKATVKVDGKEATDKTVTWKSSDEKIATVKDGVVTAVKEGKADVTATVDTASAVCKVTVDATAPKVKGDLTIPDYKTIKVTFDEAVKGEAKVDVKARGTTASIPMTVAIAEDGLSMTLTSASALAGNTSYDVILNGLTDLAGNEMAKDTTVSVTKELSYATKFTCVTTTAPCAYDANGVKIKRQEDLIKIYFTMTDQYNQECEKADRTLYGLTATAVNPETGYPMVATVDEDAYGTFVQLGYVKDNEIVVDDALTAGKSIKITLKCTRNSDGAVMGSNDIVTTLAARAGLGDAVGVNKVYVYAEETTLPKDSATGEYKILEANASYTIAFRSELFDKFLYKNATNKDTVKYVIEDPSIMTWAANNTGVYSQIDAATTSAKANVLKPGTTKVTAYLASDDKQKQEITITISPLALGNFVVENMTGTNGEATYIPMGISAKTGLTAKDFSVTVTDGANLCKEIEVVDYDYNKDKVTEPCVKVTANANGLTNKITFKVTSGTSSAVATYTSSPSTVASAIEIDPFATNAVRVGSEASTKYRVLNKQRETITTSAKVYAVVAQSDFVRVVSCDAGVLTVAGEKEGGSTHITLYIAGGNIESQIAVTVAAQARLSSLTLSKNQVSVINGDKTPGKTEYITVSAKDQDGGKFKLTPNVVRDVDKLITIAYSDQAKDDGFNVEYYKLNAKNEYEVASGSDEIAAIGITTKSEIKNVTSNQARWVKLQSKLTHKVDGKDVPDFAEQRIDILLTEARYPATLELEANSDRLALKGVACNAVKLTVKDQYGDNYDGTLLEKSEDTITDNNVTITKADNTTVGTPKADRIDTGVYEIKASVGNLGDYTVTVAIGKDAKKRTASFKLSVVNPQTNIKGIKVSNVATTDSGKTKWENGLLKSGKNYTFDCSFFADKECTKEIAVGDIAEKDTPITESEVRWYAVEKSNVNVKNGDTEVDDKTDIAHGKDMMITTDAKGGTVKLQVTYVPGVDVTAQSDVFKVSNADEVAQAGTYYLYQTDAAGKEIKKTSDDTIPLKVGGDSATVYVGGVDQYGHKINVIPSAVATQSAKDMAVTFKENAITIKPASDAKSDVLRVQVNSSTVLTIKIATAK